MLEYGLTFLDIVYKPTNTKTMLYKQAEEMPQELNHYILNRNQKDLQLWQIANRRLDEKVALMKQRCGATMFAAHLETFRHLQRAVQAQCTSAQLRGRSHQVTKLHSFDWLNQYRCVCK